MFAREDCDGAAHMLCTPLMGMDNTLKSAVQLQDPGVLVHLTRTTSDHHSQRWGSS